MIIIIIIIIILTSICLLVCCVKKIIAERKCWSKLLLLQLLLLIIIIIISANTDVKNSRGINNKIVNFAILADHRIKLKEYEKKDKYLNLARNMQVTIIPIVIGAFGTVTKGLLKGLEDLEVGRRVENIQTTTFLRTARILRRVLETWGDLLSLRLQWKTIH